MDGRIRYDFGLINETGAHAVQCAARLKDAMATLMTKANGVCGEDWEGDASVMFLQAQGKWNQKCDGLATAQTRSGTATQQCADDMRATDTQCSSLFA